MDARARSHPVAAAALLAEHVDDVVELWRELVRWDPALPTGTTPAIASAVVTAVVQALGRPQPLGWGTDPEVEKVIDVFATASGPVEVAIGHLVCLREALRRLLAELGGSPSPGEVAELQAAVNMIVDRAIAHAATVVTARLRDVTLADEHTRLPNQRSLERDLGREISRAERYGRGVTVVLFDRGPRASSDEAVPGEADAVRRLQELARAVDAAIRAGDSAYVAGMLVAVLLCETPGDVVPALVARVEQLIGGPVRWGAAVFPVDGREVDELIALAVTRCTTE